MRRGLSVMVILLAAATAAQAGVSGVEIFMIDSLGVQSEFQANTGQLLWTGGAGANVLFDGDPHWVNLDVDVTGAWTDVQDDSSGGVAAARFLNGSYTLTFSDAGTYVGTMTVNLHPSWDYMETETSEDYLSGRALVVVSDFLFEADGVQHGWQGGVGDAAGLTATTILPTGTGLADYSANWNSDNTSVTILADESGIPEPLTMGLLAAGGLALLRRRRA